MTGRHLASPAASGALLALLATLALPAAASAAEAPLEPPAAATPTVSPRAPDGTGPTVTSTMEDLLGWSTVSAVPVGRATAADRDSAGPEHRLTNRLRLGAHMGLHWDKGVVRKVEVDLEAEARNSPVWQPRRDPLLALDPRQPRDMGWDASERPLLRRLGGEIGLDFLRLGLGRTLSHWGLGLLAQDGRADPLGLGWKTGGHVVDRASLTFMPVAAFAGAEGHARAPIVLLAAFDRVVEDDLACLADGDRAWNVVTAALWRGKALQAGAYGVRRQQRDAAGLDLAVWGLDGFFAWSGVAGPWQLAASGEGLWLRGETDWLRTIEHREPLALDQGGAVLRLEGRRGSVRLRLEGGWASADADPFDDRLEAMSLARDWRVGLVLFPEVRRAQSAVAALLLQDPRFAGTAPAGAERLATGGALNGALYLGPVVRVDANEHLGLIVSGLWALATAPLVDPFATTMGGDLLGPRGGAAREELGFEFAGGLRLRQAIAPGLEVGLGLDAGWWLPGQAFDDEHGKAAPAVGAVAAQATLEGKW